MPIDVSMYSGGQQPNMLQQYGQMQGIINAQQQNQLMQQEQQRRGLEMDAAKRDKYSAQLEIEARELAALYGKEGGNPTRDHFLDAITNMGVKYPDLYGKPEIANLIRMVPSEDEVNKNPALIKNTIIGLASQVEQAKQVIDRYQPNYQMIDIGNGVKQPLDMNINTNPGLPKTQIVSGLSQQDLAAPRTWTDASGQQHQGTQADYLRATQGGNPNPGGGNVAPGIYPNGLSGAAAPQVVKSGPLAANEGVSVKPGTVEANTDVAKANAGMLVKLQDAVAGSPMRKSLISQLQELSHGFVGGPLAADKRKWLTMLNEVRGHLGYEPLQNSDSVSQQEEFNKMTELLVQEQFKALGGTGSAAHLGSSSHTSPNELMSDKGRDRILQTMQGREDAANATLDTWMKERDNFGGPGGYGDFLAKFNRNFSPRAYMLQYMDKPEMQAMYNNMTPVERNQLDDAYKFAKERGLLKQGQGITSSGQ